MNQDLKILKAHEQQMRIIENSLQKCPKCGRRAKLKEITLIDYSEDGRVIDHYEKGCEGCLKKIK